MDFSETILFYLLFGVAVAAALEIDRPRGGRGTRVFKIVTALLFWPLYLPVLLERPARARSEGVGHSVPTKPHDQYAAAIAQVESELETALRSLDGWAENVLAREEDRFAELRAAWRSQADRIRQLDRLLTSGDFGKSAGIAGASAGVEGNPRYQQSEQSRRENIERLRALRTRLHDDLLGTLAWVRELVSMIHLAKFSGAPASRAEELVSQIATAIEGLSEVTLPV